MGFLTTEDLVVAYAAFLTDNEQEPEVDERALIARLKELPGMKRVTRGPANKRQRGLAGRRLDVTRHT
jgi:hypothetical protein